MVSDQHADFFTRNLLAILAEMRAAFGVLDPEAFCTVTAVFIQSLASRAIDSPGTLTQVGQVRYATGPDGTALGMSLTQGEKDALAPYRIPAMA
jgi:hypothetical protein